MNQPPKKIPSFRIEVREPATPAAWWIIEFAHTDIQRDAMLKRRLLEYGEGNARAQPNGSMVDPDVLLRYVGDIVLTPFVSTMQFIAENNLADKLADDKSIAIGALKSPEEILSDVQAIVAGEMPPGYPPPAPVLITAAAAAQVTGTPAPVTDSAPAAGAPDALVGVTPLPFGVGDVLEDIHTEAMILVTKIHNADGTGRAFDWENLDPEAEENAKTGTCPINSVGCFAVVTDEKKKAGKKKAGQKKKEN